MTCLRMLACLVAILVSLSASADQNDPHLAELFKRLQAAPDALTAAPVEAEIWQRWTSSDNPRYQQLMELGINQLGIGDLQPALATFNNLVQLAPDFAEAWNKRATVQYLLHNYAAAELDIVQTLKLEPLHFGALSGRALVKLAQHDYEGARTAYQAVLAIYPAMTGIQQNLLELDRFLQRQLI